MDSASAVSSLPRHPALAGDVGTPFAAARLTGEQRLAIVLQAAGLLSLLERAGWYPPRGFADAWADSRGRLRGVEIGVGHGQVLPHLLLRALLLELLGSSGRVVGRGAARRAGRALAERWDQALFREHPDRLVEEILGEAPFLWGQRHGPARRALVGWMEGLDTPWIAGAGAFRSAVLARVAAGAAPEELLAGAEAMALWRSRLPALPAAELAARGRWRWAAEAAESSAAATPESRLEAARLLYAAGRFRSALERTRELDLAAAVVLRIQCQAQLGELGAVRRALPELRALRLPESETVELAEVLSRVLANLGEPESATPWIERALATQGEEPQRHAHLVAAAAHWDSDASEAMEPHLRAAKGAETRPALAWRWHNVQALYCMGTGDGERAREHLSAALGRHRRLLFPFQAGRLWNELGVARVLTGDLAGAERALRHAIRLLGGCDGPGRTTVMLHNLADVRIRRGRGAGAAELLQRVLEADRRAGNRRGLIQDEALLARWELMRGQPEAALDRIGRRLAEMDRQRLDWQRDELLALAARALGWLGRSAEAAAMLEAAGGRAALRHLEPEERPAALILAGRPGEAADEVASAGPFADLWRALLSVRAAPPAAWRQVEDGIDAYRVARFCVDAENIASGWLPAAKRQWAIGVLCRSDARRLSERLAPPETGAWTALGRFLAATDAPLSELFVEAGYVEARLVWVGEDDLEVLVDGKGGAGTLSAACGGGTLELYHPAPDDVLAALLRVVAERIRGPMRSPADPPRTAGVPGGGHRSLLGQSPQLLSALDRADRLGAMPIPVLVLGQTGTGKELVARRIHDRSPVAEGPFVPVNCAGLSETLLQSELFGHVRGAFTGAERDRLGVFETARGGTVFLDEIGDLPGEAQKVLLRVLQEGEVRRLGESTPRKVHVRIVAATHRDLERMVGEKTFRADLYYRLAVGRVELPRLAARGNDVLLLAEHFLSEVGDGRLLRLSGRARRRLQEYDWPGNVRQLRAVLLQAAALAEGDTLEPEHLELPGKTMESASDYHMELDALRRRLIVEALESTSGNQAAAARRLGVTRQALNYQVRRLGL